MEKVEIKTIACYLGEFEEGLAKPDKRGRPTHGHLTELCQIMKTLNGATFKADQELKPFLATLEMKARKCRAELEKRLGTRN
jgi:hypothetical protein